MVNTFCRKYVLWPYVAHGPVFWIKLACKNVCVLFEDGNDVTASGARACCRYELVDEDSSSLQDYISQGDNRNARLHTQIVATRLNALSSGDDTGGGGDGGFSGAPTGDGGGGDGDVTSLRKKIRRAMLSALKDLPLRDEVRTVDAPTVRHLRMYCSAAVAADIHTCICKKVRAVLVYYAL